MAINRRRFIAQFAGTAAGRCLLGPVAAAVGMNARAETDPLPRFLAFITPIGHHRDWFPSVNGAIGTLPELASPLQPFANDIAILRNQWSVLKHYGGDGAHRAGYPAATAGHVEFNTPDQQSPALGISIDQHLIKGWGNGVESLQLGVLPVGDNRSVVAWSGARKPLPPEKNARRVYEALFSAVSGTADEQAELRARNMSLFDQWTKELRQLKSDLGQTQREAFDAHIGLIETLERRMNTEVSCDADMNINNSDNFYTDNDNYPVIGKQMMDIAALALACGQHRAATIAWSRAGSGVRHKWVLGANARDHHSITHAADVDRSWVEIGKIETWYNEQFAYLVNKLAQTPDGVGGRLLDSTLVYWASETGSARSHSGAEMGVVLAGNYLNRFAMGRVYGLNKVPLNNLLAEIASNLDVPTETFGNPEFATGRLPQIRA